ncbi:MAG: glycosyltransferase [Gammaproteobacteria bacterium]|nr:glycosyltransferase [Gammaproteobacteria bacterium]
MHFSKIKLCHIITSLSAGGAQVFLYELIKNTDRSCFEVEVICLGASGPIADKISALPCKIIYLHATKLFPGMALYRLIKLLKLTQPDVVHTWMYHADLLGGIAAKLARVKRLIWSIHHSDSADLKWRTKLVMSLCAKLSYFLPNQIVLVADKSLELHRKYGYCAKKMQVISNGIDAQLFLPDAHQRCALRQVLGITEHEFVFGLFARYHPQKGFAILLEAYRLMLDQAQGPSKLLVAGAGVYSNNSELMGLIERFSLQENIVLLGEVQGVSRYLPALDALVSASVSGEACPLILMEAMSCQVPGVVTDVGDCKKIVAETGWVVSPRDVESLSRALLSAVSLSTEARIVLGRQARLRVLENFTIAKISLAYQKIYHPDKVMLVIGSSVFTLVHFRLQLIQAFQAMGYKVIAVAPVENPALISKLAEAGIGFEALNLRHTSVNPFANIGSFFSLSRIIKQHRPDLVFSYTLKPIIFGSYLAKRYKVSHIASMLTGLGYVYSGNSLKQRILQIALNRLLKSAFKKNEVVFFQNPDDAKQFIDMGLLRSTKVTVINGSGVDLNEYTSQDYPINCSFILIARLLHEKGVAEYVQAAKILKANYPHITFYVVGKQYCSPSSISAAELKLWIDEGNIDYLGELSDVRPAIAKSSVFVLPSYYREGTPRAILEAMAMARAVITTNMPGCRETVQEGLNGYLVKPKDVQALTEAMQKFIVQPDLISQMGQASRKYAEQKYDVRLVNQAILKAFKIE